ncbi:hypothetical protein BV25DRAFT_314761 [Artomyces pyxidatus]|uniref:Uncharacterized protein n=1 Tax=Artomyces pyxidatus TaxID=48021 RepID=A0ACB8T691_9AGAM|nr:hypothetical protein BV25DRAFT_314761 [Artomyces pyxidatus]
MRRAERIGGRLMGGAGFDAEGRCWMGSLGLGTASGFCTTYQWIDKCTALSSRQAITPRFEASCLRCRVPPSTHLNARCCPTPLRYTDHECPRQRGPQRRRARLCGARHSSLAMTCDLLIARCNVCVFANAGVLLAVRGRDEGGYSGAVMHDVPRQSQHRTKRHFVSPRDRTRRQAA